MRRAKQPESQAQAPAESPAAASASPGVSCTITLDLIRPSAHNPRKTFDEAELREMASSIRQFGVIEPIVVRPLYRFEDGLRTIEVDEDGYHNDPSLWPTMQFELVAGERRTRAAKLAGLAEVPAIIRRLDDTQAAVMRLIENLHRADVSPIEFANGLKELRDGNGNGNTGMTLRQIAAQIGKSEASVRGALLLVEKSPESLIQAIQAGMVSATVAELICRLPEEKREKATALVIPEAGADPMGYRLAKKRLAKRFGPKEAKDKRADEPAESESAEQFGLSQDQFDAASVACKLQGHKGKTPIAIKPLEIDGSLYVNTGGYYDGNGTTTHKLLPLMPVRFDSPDGPGYLGVLVQSKGQWYAIGSNNLERMVAVHDPKLKRMADAARKTKANKENADLAADMESLDIRDEIEGDDAPLSRLTSMAKLLDSCGISGAKRRLRDEKLDTVGDLLDAAPKRGHGAGLIQRVYGLLREVMPVESANKIGDYLIDAGLTNDGLVSVGSTHIPEIKGWRKLPIADLELSPSIGAHLKSLKIKTVGQLADRLDDLAGLKPAEVERLRVLVQDASEGSAPYKGREEERK